MALTQFEKEMRRVEKERAEARRAGTTRVPNNIAMRPIKEPPMVRVQDIDDSEIEDVVAAIEADVDQVAQEA